MKLICPFCEKKLEIDDVFSGRQAQCPFCNNIFEVPVLAPKAKYSQEEAFEQKKKHCPFCGETILAIAKKCKHCGEFLDGRKSPSLLESKVTVSGIDPFAAYHTPIQGKKAGTLTVVGYLGIIIGLVFCVGAISFLSKSGQEEFGVVSMVLGLFFTIGCFCWARSSAEPIPENHKDKKGGYVIGIILLMAVLIIIAVFSVPFFL